jgi:hypothetical protein
MGTCASHRSDQYDFIEPYSHIDLAPPADLKVVPHTDLEVLRALPQRPMGGGYFYNSTRHNILWNDRSRSIVRVYKGDVKLICPLCEQKAKPRFTMKLVEKPEWSFVKDGGLHYHMNTDIQMPCDCPNGHRLLLNYRNKCECGWPSDKK